MDEPLGALDAELREAMRAEIKRLHLAQHATTVYVTHDQVEAMAMGDRIVVMSAAAVQQVGTPARGLLQPGQPLCGPLHRQPGHEPGRRPSTPTASSTCRATTTTPVPAAWQPALAAGLRGRGGDRRVPPGGGAGDREGAICGQVYATTCTAPTPCCTSALERGRSERRGQDRPRPRRPRWIIRSAR